MLPRPLRIHRNFGRDGLSVAVRSGVGSPCGFYFQRAGGFGVAHQNKVRAQFPLQTAQRILLIRFQIVRVYRRAHIVVAFGQVKRICFLVQHIPARVPAQRKTRVIIVLGVKAAHGGQVYFVTETFPLHRFRAVHRVFIFAYQLLVLLPVFAFVAARALQLPAHGRVAAQQMVQHNHGKRRHRLPHQAAAGHQLKGVQRIIVKENIHLPRRQCPFAYFLVGQIHGLGGQRVYLQSGFAGVGIGYFDKYQHAVGHGLRRGGQVDAYHIGFLADVRPVIKRRPLHLFGRGRVLAFRGVAHALHAVAAHFKMSRRRFAPVGQKSLVQRRGRIVGVVVVARGQNFGVGVAVVLPAGGAVPARKVSVLIKRHSLPPVCATVSFCL